MANLSKVEPHMEVIGADGVRVGTVDKVVGDRIKLTKGDSGSHKSHHHYLSGGLVASVEDGVVRLSANGANAALMEEEYGGEALPDRKRAMLRRAGIGAAAVAGLTALGALGRRLIGRRRSGGSRD